MVHITRENTVKILFAKHKNVPLSVLHRKAVAHGRRPRIVLSRVPHTELGGGAPSGR